MRFVAIGLSHQQFYRLDGTTTFQAKEAADKWQHLHGLAAALECAASILNSNLQDGNVSNHQVKRVWELSLLLVGSSDAWAQSSQVVSAALEAAAAASLFRHCIAENQMLELLSCVCNALHQQPVHCLHFSGIKLLVASGIEMDSVVQGVSPQFAAVLQSLVHILDSNSRSWLSKFVLVDGFTQFCKLTSITQIGDLMPSDNGDFKDDVRAHLQQRLHDGPLGPQELIEQLQADKEFWQQHSINGTLKRKRAPKNDPHNLASEFVQKAIELSNRLQGSAAFEFVEKAKELQKFVKTR